MNTSEKEIEANQPAEAVDSIEAIKDKILKAGHEVPLITNQVGWICLLNSGIISSDEKIAFTNHISKPSCAPQPAGALGAGASAERPLVNFQLAVDASLFLSIEVEVETVVKKKRKKSTQSCSVSGVAVSRKRAVAALHGRFQLGTPVKVTTRNGTVLFGRVELEEFVPDKVDIATIVLEDAFEFTHFIECSFERVKLLQPLVVIGLQYGRTTGDAVYPYTRMTAVELIEEGDDSALFQANYYNFDGCSGAGVITKVVNGTPKLIGVHIASHEDFRRAGAVKRKRKATFANLEADIRSVFHCRDVYSLVCEIARVPSLITLLSSSDT